MYQKFVIFISVMLDNATTLPNNHHSSSKYLVTVSSASVLNILKHQLFRKASVFNEAVFLIKRTKNTVNISNHSSICYSQFDLTIMRFFLLSLVLNVILYKNRRVFGLLSLFGFNGVTFLSYEIVIKKCYLQYHFDVECCY